MLSSGSNIIGLKAILDDAAFQKGITNYSKSVANADKQTQTVAGRMGSAFSQAGASIQGLGKVALAGFGLVTAGATAAAGALTALIIPATMSAARTQEMAAVLQLVGERAGWSAEQIEQNQQAIVDLGIRTDTAQGLLTQFARYQLDAADATNLARVAQDAAVISMSDSSDTLERLQHGILTQNSMVLRNAGVNVQAGQAISDYAEELGIATEELTDAQRIQAVMNAVMEEGTRIAGAYDTAMEQPGKQLRSLSRHFYEASRAMGIHFLPAMSDVIMGITGGIKGIRGLLEEGEPLSRVFESLGRILHAILPSVFDFEGGLDAIAVMADNVADFLEPIADAVEGIASAFRESEDPISAIAKIVWDLGLAFGMSTDETVGLYNIVKDVLTAFDNLFSGLESGEDTIESVAEFVGAIAGAFGASEEQAKKFFDIVHGVGDFISGIITPIREWVMQNFALKDVLGAIGIAILSVVLPALGGIITAVAPIVLAFVGLVAAVRLFRGIWEEDWGGIKTFIMDAWSGTIQPALMGMWQWLQEFIPVAIQALATYWQETLLPAIQTFITWVGEVLIPKLGELWSWLQENIPMAIQALATYWQETLQPAIQTVWTFITDSFIPALGTLWTWLATNIPAAIETVSQFWSGTLLPAIQGVWSWISDNLLPVFASIWSWLSTMIPAAISTAATVWKETFKPALEIIWGFISENIIPVFETVAAWLGENIPNAIEAGLEFWDNFFTALSEIWAFLDEFVFPIFEEIAGIIGETLRIAVEGMALLWQDVLAPALQTVWDWLSENVLPILQEIGTFISDTLSGIFGGFIEDKLGGMSSGLEIVKDWLEKVLGWLTKLKEFLATFSWGALNETIKNSPVPLADGIKLSTAAIQAFTSEIGKLGVALKDLIIDEVMDLGGILGLGKQVGGIGGGLMSLYEAQTIDPLEDRVKGQMDALEKLQEQLEEARETRLEGPQDIFAQETMLAEEQRILNEIAAIEAQRAIDAEALAEAKKRQYEWEKAQQDLQFLQMQMDLLDFIQEHGLNPDDIFEGFQFGLDASLPDLIDIMTAAMQAVVESANDVLQTGSPSKVFHRLGELVSTSFGMGIANRRSYAVDAVKDMTSRVSTQPISNINNSRTMNLYMENQVSNDMDLAWLQASVRQTIREEFSGGLG